MRRAKPIKVEVKVPSRGVVTRYPSDTADQLRFGDQDRVFVSAQNVRFEEGVVRNRPGFELATLTEGYMDTDARLIWQGNVASGADLTPFFICTEKYINYVTREASADEQLFRFSMDALAAPGPGTVSSIVIVDSGDSYATPPTLAIIGGGGSGATATCTVAGGIITTVTVTAPGSGYTSRPTVGITGGGGSGAELFVVLSSDDVVSATFPDYPWRACNFNDKAVFAQNSVRPRYWVNGAAALKDVQGLSLAVSGEEKFDGCEAYFGHLLLWRGQTLKWSDVNDLSCWIPVAETVSSMRLTTTAGFTQPSPGGTVTGIPVAEDTTGLTVGQYVRIDENGLR